MKQDMTQIPQVDPSSLVPFAFVCEGEVAFIIRVPEQNEHFLSVLQSNPIIVEFGKDETVELEYLYKDGKFVKP